MRLSSTTYSPSLLLLNIGAFSRSISYFQSCLIPRFENKTYVFEENDIKSFIFSFFSVGTNLIKQNFNRFSSTLVYSVCPSGKELAPLLGVEQI